MCANYQSGKQKQTKKKKFVPWVTYYKKPQDGTTGSLTSELHAEK